MNTVIKQIKKDILDNPNGHVWEIIEDEDEGTIGEVDFHASYGEFHNGPRCSKCGYEFCMFCKGVKDIPACKPPDSGANDKVKGNGGKDLSDKQQDIIIQWLLKSEQASEAEKELEEVRTLLKEKLQAYDIIDTSKMPLYESEYWRGQKYIVGFFL